MANDEKGQGKGVLVRRDHKTASGEFKKKRRTDPPGKSNPERDADNSEGGGCGEAEAGQRDQASLQISGQGEAIHAPDQGGEHGADGFRDTSARWKMGKRNE